MPMLVRDRDVTILRGQCPHCKTKGGRHSLIITGFEENYSCPEGGFVIYKCIRCTNSFGTPLIDVLRQKGR